MGSAFLTRKGGGGATITFDNRHGLERNNVTSLSVARTNLAATTVGSYALFGGGSGGGYSSTVDAYSTSLSRSTPTALSVASINLAATTVGNYALFGGGYNNGGCSSTVDAYSIDNKVTIYPGAKYKFSGMSSEVTATEYKQIQVNTPINGYIKLKNVTLN